MNTLRQSPLADNMAFVLSDVYASADSILEIAPRNALKAHIDQLSATETFSVDLSFVVTLNKVKDDKEGGCPAKGIEDGLLHSAW